MLCFTGIFSHCTFVFKLVLWLIPGTRTIRRDADKINSGTYSLSDVSVIMDEEKTNWVVYNKDWSSSKVQKSASKMFWFAVRHLGISGSSWDRQVEVEKCLHVKFSYGDRRYGWVDLGPNGSWVKFGGYTMQFNPLECMERLIKRSSKRWNYPTLRMRNPSVQFVVKQANWSHQRLHTNSTSGSL